MTVPIAMTERSSEQFILVQATYDYPKYIASNHNIYLLYAAKMVQQTFFDLFTQHASFRGIKLRYIVDLFNKFHNFHPFKVTKKTNSKTLTDIETSDLIDYVENNTIKNNDWRPIFTDRTLLINIAGMIACDIGENFFGQFIPPYTNYNNKEVLYAVYSGSSLYNIIVSKKQYCVFTEGVPNEIIYHRRRQPQRDRFECKGNVATDGLIDIFEKEFHLTVPFDKYLEITQTDKLYKITEGETFISYNTQRKEFSISIDHGPILSEKFEQIFQIKLPLSRSECEQIISSNQISLHSNIRKDIFSYFTDSERSISRFILRLTPGLAPRIIPEHTIYFGKNSFIRTFGRLRINRDYPTLIDEPAVSLSQYEELSNGIVNIAKNVLIDLSERVPIPAVTNSNGLFGTVLGTLFFTYAFSNLMVMYSPGPTEMTISSSSTWSRTKVTTRDIFSGEKSFEINLTTGEDYNVLTASEEHMTKDGDLIVWKGVCFADGSPGIVQLLIPKNARIMPNTEGLKFRTDRCKVQNIYKPNIYECYNCKNCALYDYDGIFYCTGCATLIVKELEAADRTELKIHLIDITKSERRDTAYSQLFPGFTYKLAEEIKIPDFKLEMSKCDKQGIYFFFRIEQVFNYMFKPMMKQDVKIGEHKNKAAAPEEIYDEDDGIPQDEIRRNGLRLRRILGAVNDRDDIPLLRSISPRSSSVIKKHPNKKKCVIQ
ncbi:MAG: hypothetical protein Hyperionvirus4_134 [Hyperionvirus sp.]|uniref:Uncharacterized protein n=1 Tax=Hyperionvirus sp. TaxID=2487770 RepID=A0A3G5ACU4_9VIRU|nr:MAG: hypothetical protein Hyperionvirus4_134 [Hyperionvirus sp.]